LPEVRGRPPGRGREVGVRGGAGLRVRRPVAAPRLGAGARPRREPPGGGSDQGPTPGRGGQPGGRAAGAPPPARLPRPAPSAPLPGRGYPPPPPPPAGPPRVGAAPSPRPPPPPFVAPLLRRPLPDTVGRDAHPPVSDSNTGVPCVHPSPTVWGRGRRCGAAA